MYHLKKGVLMYLPDLNIILTLIGLVLFYPTLGKASRVLSLIKEALKNINSHNDNMLKSYIPLKEDITSLRLEVKGLKKEVCDSKLLSGRSILLFLVILFLVFIAFLILPGKQGANTLSDDLVSAATFINNFFTPIILTLTLFVIFKTWINSRQQFEKTNAKLEQQLLIQQRKYKLEAFKNRLESFNEICSKNIESIFVYQALSDTSRLIREHSPSNFYLFEDFCLKQPIHIGKKFPDVKSLEYVGFLHELSESINYKLTDLKIPMIEENLTRIFSSNQKFFNSDSRLSLFYTFEREFKLNIIKAMIHAKSHLFKNAYTKAYLLEKALKEEEDTELKIELIDIFNTTIDLAMYEDLNLVRKRLRLPL